MRAATDWDPRATVLSIDGVGAYDHVLRSAMLSKLYEVESLRGLLPFVRATYAQPSCHQWKDENGGVRQITQHEGGEQGDPLMPLLFSLAVHNGLTEVQEQLVPGECLFAFLDDVYALCSPERTRTMYNALEERLFFRAGIRLHTGKTRTWNRAGVVPEGMPELGEDVWNPLGIVVLGTPVGTDEFHQAATQERLAEQEVLWRTIPHIRDLQCAWQLLEQCASPRCHHFVRTVPPRLSAVYAQSHDNGMRQVMTTSLEGVPGNHHQQVVAVQLVSLPMRMGRLGLRSASKIAPAAYWASWADALPMIQGRVPQIAGLVVQLLDQDATGCLGELQQATATLDWSGFVGTPNWRSLSARARPPPMSQAEPGEWQHGWQYYASSSLEFHFRETVVLAQSSAADQAHLRSHSGPGANEVLGTAPTKPEFTVEAAVFRTLILERLRLPLGITDARCQCGGHLERAPSCSLPKVRRTSFQSRCA